MSSTRALQPSILVLLAFVGVLGCTQSDDKPGASANPTTTTLIQKTTPSPTATPNPTPEAAQVVPVATPSTGDNPRRTYQLKDLKKIPLKVGKAHITVWIMDTDQKREEGMMYLVDREVRANEGMLFVFREPQGLSFWMRNTELPLDLMYVDETKHIVNIAKGKPMDETPLPSARPALYVIEMKQGSAKRLGINSGDAVGIPAAIKAWD